MKDLQIPPPRQYSGKEVKKIRESAGLSQESFSVFCCGDKWDVLMWEEHNIAPRLWNCRALEIMERHPGGPRGFIIAHLGRSAAKPAPSARRKK
jgi:DNA-binding transcriptional regulator YiaG